MVQMVLSLQDRPCLGCDTFFGLQKAPLHLRHSGAFRRVLDGWLPPGLKSCLAQLEQACEVSACLLPACQQ